MTAASQAPVPTWTIEHRELNAARWFAVAQAKLGTPSGCGAASMRFAVLEALARAPCERCMTWGMLYSSRLFDWSF